MPAGLQVWDATGALVLDTSTIVARVLGSITTSDLSGSLTDAGFLTGNPFWAVATSQPWYFNALLHESISVTGSTLAWDFTAGFVGPGGTFTIIYGVGL